MQGVGGWNVQKKRSAVLLSVPIIVEMTQTDPQAQLYGTELDHHWLSKFVFGLSMKVALIFLLNFHFSLLVQFIFISHNKFL